MSTGLITHPDCLNHITPHGHPERVERLETLNDLFKLPEFDELHRYQAPLCDKQMIELAHPPRHHKQIFRSEPKEGFTSLDPDTHLSLGSLNAARRAVGANTLAVDLVLKGEINNAFCAVRPPGHHAETTRAMGFCLFGNVIIGALHALENHALERIGIVDFDVHHGNGTSDIAWGNERIFFASTHEMPLFPGTGFASESGAYGQIVNVPLSSGSGGADLRKAFETKILPQLSDHKPDCIFISAGFDAHFRDPLASLRWTEDDFAWATNSICDVADECCSGRVISSLEGGYDLKGLRDSVALHVRCLMDRGQ